MRLTYISCICKKVYIDNKLGLNHILKLHTFSPLLSRFIFYVTFDFLFILCIPLLIREENGNPL